MDFNITDGQAHQLALYFQEGDPFARTQSIQIVDATTSTLLDNQVLATFTNGKYLVWNIRGHLQVRIINNFNTINSVLSGFFFDPVP